MQWQRPYTGKRHVTAATGALCIDQPSWLLCVRHSMHLHACMGLGGGGGGGTLGMRWFSAGAPCPLYATEQPCSQRDACKAWRMLSPQRRMRSQPSTPVTPLPPPPPIPISPFPYMLYWSGGSVLLLLCRRAPRPPQPGPPPPRPAAPGPHAPPPNSLAPQPAAATERGDSGLGRGPGSRQHHDVLCGPEGLLEALHVMGRWCRVAEGLEGSPSRASDSSLVRLGGAEKTAHRRHAASPPPTCACVDARQAPVDCFFRLTFSIALCVALVCVCVCYSVVCVPP